MNTPKRHQVIQIGRSSQQLLVTESEATSSRDEMRGDVYHGWSFKTIPISAAAGSIKMPKEKTWTVDGFSMGGPNMVDLKNIRVVGTAKVSTETTITFEVTPV